MTAELINTKTGEIAETMSRDEAEEITGRIATELDQMANAYEAVVPMIADAFDRRAWVALGYRANGSARWIADNFDGVLGRLKADVRQEIGERVREDVPGISTRGLAALTGVSTGQAHADQNPFSSEQISDPEPEPEDASEPATGEVLDSPTDAERVAEAVAEFPDLTWYAEIGRTADVLRLANALRGYSEPELSQRLDNLRKTIAAEQRPRPEPETEGPDYYGLANLIFDATNSATQVINKSGGSQTLAEAIAMADPIEVHNWIGQFAQLSTLCRELAEACSPGLRAVK